MKSGLSAETLDKETIISKEMWRRPVSYFLARASILRHAGHFKSRRTIIRECYNLDSHSFLTTGSRISNWIRTSCSASCKRKFSVSKSGFGACEVTAYRGMWACDIANGLRLQRSSVTIIL